MFSSYFRKKKNDIKTIVYLHAMNAFVKVYCVFPSHYFIDRRFGTLLFVGFFSHFLYKLLIE